MKTIYLFEEIADDIQKVEEELQNLVETEIQILSNASAHLLRAGGKRLRPAFVLLAGKFHNDSRDKLIPLAVALELIHMASLVHDDVIDASMTRRGVPTVKACWGNRISMHTGDYLFARALQLVSQYDDPRIIRILADVSVKMVEGEIQQIITAFDVEQGLKDYLYRIKRKTAILISTSCGLGAIASGAPPEIVRGLTRYGHYVGMAFQITDDLLDFTSTEKELGKAVGSDLSQGIITLPVIYTLRSGFPGIRLRELIKDIEQGGDGLAEALEIVRKGPGILASYNLVDRYVEKAKQELRWLPPTPTRDTLSNIADFISNRQF
ncbi:MAG: polyprenyl synthetase family protein [Bacillota bacterium]|jgi:heptaprenyl diphosphate synthase